MKKITAISTAVLMGLALTACSTDRPQHGPRAEQGMNKHFSKDGLPRDLSELSLTDAQKDQIKQIMAQGQVDRPAAPDESQRAAFRSEIQQRRAAEQQLILAPTFDETAARQLVAQRAKKMDQRQQQRSEMELQHLKQRHDIMQVLTPEQRQQWLANQQKHHDKKGDRRDDRREPMSPQQQ